MCTRHLFTTQHNAVRPSLCTYHISHTERIYGSQMPRNLKQCGRHIFCAFHHRNWFHSPVGFLKLTVLLAIIRQSPVMRRMSLIPGFNRRPWYGAINRHWASIPIQSIINLPHDVHHTGLCESVVLERKGLHFSTRWGKKEKKHYWKGGWKLNWKCCFPTKREVILILNIIFLINCWNRQNEKQAGNSFLSKIQTKKVLKQGHSETSLCGEETSESIMMPTNSTVNIYSN